jgi:predicted RNase H-like HicB family nuclease
MSTARYTTSVSAGHGGAYKVILEPSEDGDGIWTAEIPALGIVTEGRGRAGAEGAAENAVRGYRATAERHGKAVPAGDLQVTTVRKKAAPAGR